MNPTFPVPQTEHPLRLLRVFFALILLAGVLSACSVTPTKPDYTAALSGNELSTGKRDGYQVTGAIFAGTDNAGCNCWSDESTGGTWIANINYAGRGGTDSSVDVTGGTWTWLQANGLVHAGVITGGSVNWPPSLESNAMECGNGVARFAITLAVGKPERVGSFAGCLDDMHLDPRQQPFVFPQKIWGELKFPQE